MVYFFSKAEKSNSLALTDCVNAFFFRLAGILKLRKKAGESSSKWFFVVFHCFPHLNSAVEPLIRDTIMTTQRLLL